MCIRRAEDILNDPACDLPDIVKDECRDLLAQITENANPTTIKTSAINSLASETEMARRLQTIPGIGTMTAMAIEAFVPVKLLSRMDAHWRLASPVS